MRMRVLTKKLRVEIENEMRVFLESLNFEIEMRVSQKSGLWENIQGDQKSCLGSKKAVFTPTRDNSSVHPVRKAMAQQGPIKKSHQISDLKIKMSELFCTIVEVTKGPIKGPIKKGPKIFQIVKRCDSNFEIRSSKARKKMRIRNAVTTRRRWDMGVTEWPLLER